MATNPTDVIDTTGATFFASFINDVFARNATPKVTMTSADVSVLTLDDIATYGLLDLYDKVNAANSDTAYSDVVLVTGIEQTITPSSWTVSLALGGQTAVASPAIQPDVTSGQPNIPVGAVYLATGTQATSIPHGAVTQLGAGWTGNQPGYITTAAFSNYASGVWTFTTAGMFHIVASVTFSASNAGRRIVLIYKNGNEISRCDVGAPNQATTGLSTPQVDAYTPMAVGDTLDIRVYQTSGAALALQTPPNHQLFVHKVAN